MIIQFWCYIRRKRSRTLTNYSYRRARMISMFAIEYSSSCFVPETIWSIVLTCIHWRWCYRIMDIVLIHQRNENVSIQERKYLPRVGCDASPWQNTTVWQRRAWILFSYRYLSNGGASKIRISLQICRLGWHVCSPIQQTGRYFSFDSRLLYHNHAKKLNQFDT
jgi:hypothetical protein